ncbi:MAG: MATE family efflux transporter [Magnetovibrio sp.]|nr:MATE family efflux transporter [Magnetovibrio sp.]
MIRILLSRETWLHIAEMIRLAPPIVLARSGMILIVLVDTVMVGHYGAVELGFLAMGMSLFQPLLVTSIGLIMGTLVLTAHFYGAKKFKECGKVWRRSIAYSLALGIISAIVSLYGDNFLTWSGQSPRLAAEGGKVMALLGLGLPGHMLFITCSFFLEGIRRPIPGFLAIILANLINFLLNWLFIYGNIDGLPVGATGAAMATSITRWIVAAFMIVYIFFMRDCEKFGVRQRVRGNLSSWTIQRRLGYATGVSLGIETAAFSIIQQFAGWLGPIPLAAFTITFYLLVFSFMVAIGFGAATTVRVSNAHGRKEHRDMAFAGWTGLGLTTLATTIIGIFLVFFDENVVQVFTNDTEVYLLATPLVFWAAIALVTDGGQAVMANALRGRQDIWVACTIQAFSFLALMVPLTWYLVFPLEAGITGIFYGISGSTIIATALLSARFYWLYRRDCKKYI